MALPPSDEPNEAFLREVDEEYRRDVMLGIWQRYGRWIVAAVIALLVGLGIYLYLGNRSDRMAGKAGEQYDAALRVVDQQPAEAVAQFDKVAAKDSGGYSAMARIAEGNLLLKKKDAKGAAAKFAEVVNDKGYARPYRDYALIRQTVAEYETLKPAVVIDRLKDLSNPNSPWLGTAGELVAAAYLKAGKRAEAGRLYGQIAQGGETVPESIRQRAVQLAGVLGVDAIDQTKENKAQ